MAVGIGCAGRLRCRRSSRQSSRTSLYAPVAGTTCSSQAALLATIPTQSPGLLCATTVALLLALTFLFSWAPAARAAEDDFLDHYKAGLAAIARQDYRTTVDSMRLAINGKPAEDPRLARKLYLKRYLPYYYLGKALFELGDCPAAIVAWDESERQGVVQKFEEAKELERGRAVCRQRLAASAAADESLTQARRRLSRAEEAARHVTQLAGRPDLAAAWDRGEPSLAAREDEAAGLLAEARGRMPGDASNADPARIQAAADLASQALARFEAIESEARRFGQEAEAERRTVADRLGAALASSRELLATGRDLEPYPREIGRRRAELEGAVASGEALAAGSGSGSQAELEAAIAALEGAQTRLKKAVAPPPDALSRAADALFRGDYERVLKVLEGARFSEARAAAHASLFRAAARFALYVASGESDAVLLGLARADVAACRAADPERAPLASAFSPRFVEFFRLTAAGPASPGR